MAILGGAVTNKFVIGNFELRVGPQELAGKLTSAHSVGVIDRFAVRTQQQSADLMGLFPQELIDTDVVSQTTQLTATLREFSPRNMNMLLGNGLTRDNYVVEGNTTSALVSGAGSAEVLPSITIQNPPSSLTITSLNRKVWVIDTAGSFIQVNAGISSYDKISGKITFDGIKTPWSTSTPAAYMLSVFGAAELTAKKYTPLFVGKIVSTAPSTVYTGKIATTGTGSAAVTTLDVFAGSTAAANAAVDGLGDKYVQFCTVAVTGATTTVTTHTSLIKITSAVASGSLISITLGTAPPVGATHYRLRSGTASIPFDFFGVVTSYEAYVAPGSTAANTVQLSSEFSGVVGAYNNMHITVSNPTVGNLQFVVKDYTVAGGIRTAKVEYIGPNAATAWPTSSPRTIPANSTAKITTVTEAYSGLFANDAGVSSVTAKISSVDTATKTVSFTFKDDTDFKDYTATITTSEGTKYYAVVAESVFASPTVTVSFVSDRASIVDVLAVDDTIELNATNYKAGVSLLLAADEAKYTNTTILKGTRLLLWDKSNHDEVQLVTVTEDSLPAKSSGQYRSIHFTPGLAFEAHVGYHGDYGIALVDPVSMGNQSGVTYLSASLIMKDRAIEAPIVFDFWKVAVSSGLNLSLNATDFSSVDLVLDVLEPTESDKKNIYPALASTINTHPLYRYSSTPDV